jgi:hypothetical protein
MLSGDTPNNPGGGRTIIGSAFGSDDGSADPALRALLETKSATARERIGVARLLVAVVAVADEIDHESGADKDSHMAVVSMVNAAGERGLLAFTGLDAMALWDRAARPVPVTGVAAARAALEDGNTAMVIDVCGPHRYVVAGDDLIRLADQ